MMETHFAVLYGAGFIATTIVAMALAGSLLIPSLKRWMNTRVARMAQLLNLLFLSTSASRAVQVQLASAACFGVLLAIGFGVPAGLLAGAALALAILWGPGRWLEFRHVRRVRTFNQQLPDALRSVANGIKAGLVLPQAIQLVVDNMSPPSSQEFGLLLHRYQLGMPIDEALETMGKRLRSPTLELALIALLIGRRAGGDLGRILEATAHAIEQLQQLEEKIHVATSQGRLQAIVVSLLPPVFATLVYFMDPGMILPLFKEPLGWMILGGIVTLEAIGVFLIRRILSVQV